MEPNLFLYFSYDKLQLEKIKVNSPIANEIIKRRGIKGTEIFLNGDGLSNYAYSLLDVKSTLEPVSFKIAEGKRIEIESEINKHKLEKYCHNPMLPVYIVIAVYINPESLRWVTAEFSKTKIV